MLQIQDEMVKSYMNTDDKKLKGYLNNACYIVPLFSRTNSLKYIWRFQFSAFIYLNTVPKSLLITS